MDKKTDRVSGRAEKVRKIAGDILIALVVIFTVYLSVVMIRRINTVVLKDTYRTIFINELILCGILLLCALDIRFLFFTKPRFKPLKILGWAVRSVVTVLALAIVIMFGKVIAGSLVNTAGDAKNAVVLGMALEDGKPTGDLLLRLDTAQRYLEKHPDCTLILTGGNPDGSGRTEAAVMKDILTERGVPEDKMILEDGASTTRDNFANTARIVDPSEPLVFISSNYHMDRAVSMAKEAGFTAVKRCPAPSDPLRYGANVMWEVILEINELKSAVF